MKDWGYEPEVSRCLPPHLRVVSGGPVFHVYRVHCKGLNHVLMLPYHTVRTPFTALLDAAKSVWVLASSVTFRGQLQTGEGYHRHHGCGNSYTKPQPLHFPAPEDPRELAELDADTVSL